MKDLHSSVGQSHRALDDLRDRVRAGDIDAAEEAVERLGATLEELDVAVEELFAQNQELMDARASLEEERRRFADLFHFAPAPYVVTDGEGVIRHANEAAGRLLGVPADRLTSKLLAVFVPRRERLTLRRRMRRPPAPGTPFEIAIMPRHGAVVTCAALVVAVPGRDPDDPELRWLFRDVTEARRAQADLQAAFARQGEEADRLRELDRWKDTFLAAAAHDLRAPLANIVAGAETLETREDIANRAQVIRSISANAHRLARLLSDLLDLNRFTTGTVEPARESTDVAELVRDVLAQSELAARRPVDVDVPALTADIDPGRTGQILMNLLRNAVAHTPEGTPVSVRAHPTTDGLRIIVEDEGPGVPDDFKPDLFQPFVTRPAHDHDKVGTGIGLSLVRLFAELHGGTAQVMDRPGGGARFVVDLPARISTP